jgi:hypothetical protein
VTPSFSSSLISRNTWTRPTNSVPILASTGKRVIHLALATRQTGRRPSRSGAHVVRNSSRRSPREETLLRLTDERLLSRVLKLSKFANEVSGWSLAKSDFAAIDAILRETIPNPVGEGSIHAPKARCLGPNECIVSRRSSGFTVPRNPRRA